MLYFEHTFENSLLKCGGIVKMQNNAATQRYRALVLNEHSNTMRTMFRELLHDFGKVDCEEEVSPREFSKHVNLLVIQCSIRQDSGPCYSAPRRAKHVILHSAKLGTFREVAKAISKKAYRLNQNTNTLCEQCNNVLVIRRICSRDNCHRYVLHPKHFHDE